MKISPRYVSNSRAANEGRSARSFDKEWNTKTLNNIGGRPVAGLDDVATISTRELYQIAKKALVLLTGEVIQQWGTERKSWPYVVW